MDVYQSWLGCFLIGVWVFIHYLKWKLFNLFSMINLAYVLEINEFRRDYSNLNNLFQRY